MADAAPAGVGAHLVRGTAWGIVQVGVQKGCGVVTYLAMAYLLEPAELGAATLAVTITAMLTWVYPGAAGDIVVQRHGEGDRIAAAATRLAFLAGIGVMILAAVLSPAVSAWKSDPALVALLVVASSRMLFEGLASVPQAIARSRLEFGYVSAVETGVAALTVALTVGLAAAGLGAMSIVLAVSAAGAFRVGVMASLRPWPWRAPGAGSAARGLWPDFRSGGLQHFLNGATQNVDYLMLSVFAGEAALGVYTIAYQLASLSNVVFSFTIGLVAQPLFSRLAAEPARQHAAYLDTQAVGLAVSTVAAFSMACLAQAAIPVLLPQRWHDSGSLLAVLALGFGISSLQPIAQSLMRANGQYRKALRLQVVSTLLLALAVFVGAWLAGAMGVALAVVMVTASMALVHLAASVQPESRPAALGLAMRSICCSTIAFVPAGAGVVAGQCGLLPWVQPGSWAALGTQAGLVAIGGLLWWRLAALLQPTVRSHVVGRLGPLARPRGKSQGA